MLGNCYHMLEFSDDGLLVPQHLLKFDLVHQALRRIRFGGGVAPPNLALHVVLKQHSRGFEFIRKIHSRIEEVRNGNIKTASFKKPFYFVFYQWRRKPAHSVRRRQWQTSQIVQTTRDEGHPALSGTNGDRCREVS